MKFYELDELIAGCIDEETGEIINVEALEQLEMDRQEKIERVLLFIKHQRYLVEAMKAEKKELDNRIRIEEKAMEGCKDFIARYLNYENFKSAKCQASFRKSKSVEADIEQIKGMFDADMYLRKKEPELDKVAIKKALEEGLNIPGARLVTKVSVIVK